MTIRLRTLLLVALSALALGFAGAALVVWIGVYDVSAKQHTGPVYQLLEVALRRAVAARADTVPQPVPDLAAPTRVRDGAAHYSAHCVQCHGAPGISPDPFAFGLRPAPANLLAAGRGGKAEELFWVVKNGIKMSGMPAWDYRLTDDQIWSVVAFVQAMTRMTVAQYAQLAASVAAQPPAAATPAAALRPGDAQAGRRATAQYLCATCHRIPGFVGADQHVGPPLEGIAGRAFIGGVIANTPQNMVRWLQNPQALDPLSAMPPLGLSEQDAHDIAAFLYTLDKVSHK